MSPARLGVGDGFGEGAATTWVSTDKEAAKKAEAKAQKDKEFAAKVEARRQQQAEEKAKVLGIGVELFLGGVPAATNSSPPTPMGPVKV